MIPIGRSVIVPANGTLPNIILSPRSYFRIRQALERERFDVLHLHEPLTPTPCVTALAIATCPIVGDAPCVGRPQLGARAMKTWGFLMQRIDHRIAVSEQARVSAQRWTPASTR